MTAGDFITMLFCRIGYAMRGVPKHILATLYPSEVVMPGVLFALTGVGERAFDRWVRRDYHPLFTGLPERTRLFRVLTHVRTWISTNV
jgi:ABC-type microcin C transport system permease subunit YejB